MIKAVLFDLDGTLLPMDFDEFTGGYFKLLAKKAIPYGYESQKLIETIWGGCKAMAMNDGHATNEDVFWNYFASVYGEDKLKDKVIFDEFYATEFDQAKSFCGYNPEAKNIVKWLQEKDVRTILATNPIFPEVATKHRIEWVGLDVSDFEFYTVYETSRHAKPNPVYYSDVLEQAGLKADEVVMIGNDVVEDLAATKIGITVFLLTDCIINKENRDISDVPHGGFGELKKFLISMLDTK